MCKVPRVGLMWRLILLVPMKEGPANLNFFALLKNRRRDAGAAETIAGMRERIANATVGLY